MKKADDSLQGDELRRHDLRRPREAEVQSIQDAIRVAKEVGARLHVFHISTAEGGRMVADAAAGATVIIVSQRISTVSSADQIVVVDNGTVVGSGTHDDLLAGCAAYRELADSQSVSAGER